MKHYRVALPTKPYLRKYLETKYGSPLHVDPQTDFGDIIITKLSSTLHCTMDHHDIDVRLKRLTDPLLMHVPIHWFYRLQLKELTPHQVIRINRFFENQFESDLHQVVHRAHCWLGVQRQTAIECFAQNHGITLEEDITFEGLKKMEYRHRMQFSNAAKVEQTMATEMSRQMQLFA